MTNASRRFLLPCVTRTCARVLAIALGIVWSSVYALDPQPEDTYGRADASQAVTATSFMVASANPHATRVGYEILKQGGTAIDAAVALQLMLNLVEPQSSGIGGGAFLVYWNNATGELQTIDGRETAPAAATPDYFLDASGEPKGFWQSVVGGRSVGVPGTLKLLELAHSLYGTQPWASLFQPTIRLAESGFEISPRLAASIAGANTEDRQLAKFDATRAYFFNPDGSPKTAGSILKNPAFADTLRLIARQGADVFYRGEIADDIVAAVTATSENPGIMTLEDLADYKAWLRPPVCMRYRVYDVCGMGPPTSGGITVGQMLGVLSHFNIPDIGMGPDAVHLFAEAGKLAYADRAMYIADSDYVAVPVAGLLDPGYLLNRAQLVDINTAMPAARAGNPPWINTGRRAPDTNVELPGTSHFVIVDADGNAVSMTTTIETGFGSRVMVRGFLLNNELTDFSRAPEQDGHPVANRVEGGKRPRSSMAPTIVLRDGQPHLLVGSPGGSRIINYVAQTIVAVLDWGMDPQQAIDLGRFVNRNGATDLEMDTGVADLKATLEARGHELNVRDLNSGLHAISLQDGLLIGGADPRREGTVMGE